MTAVEMMRKIRDITDQYLNGELPPEDAMDQISLIVWGNNLDADINVGGRHEI